MTNATAEFAFVCESTQNAILEQIAKYAYEEAQAKAYGFEDSANFWGGRYFGAARIAQIIYGCFVGACAVPKLEVVYVWIGDTKVEYTYPQLDELRG